MNKKFRLVLLFILMLSIVCCKHVDSESSKAVGSDMPYTDDYSATQEFKDYWYSGKAELNRYKLKQARYGEIHEGDAVLIFVTEDFLADRQVKFEGGDSGEEVESVLKLNFTRKFNTGIYPYSMMSSIFTPVSNPYNTLKVTTTNQEWCGHTFAQLNKRSNGYNAQLFSYFMEEGDSEISIKDVILEDELWNVIRLDPKNLPVGEVQILPGTQFLRLRHYDFKPQAATASLNEYKVDSLDFGLKVYKIDYMDINRVLEITFKANFPYDILSWQETTDAGFGDKGTLTTTAVRTHSISEPYWSQNSVADSVMRSKLGLN